MPSGTFEVCSIKTIDDCYTLNFKCVEGDVLRVTLEFIAYILQKKTNATFKLLKQYNNIGTSTMFFKIEDANRFAEKANSIILLNRLSQNK